MVPFDKQAVTVIRQNKIGVDTTYEPPLRVGFGISDKTVDIANAVMGRTVLVPGAEPNPTHYHKNNDVCWYIMSGKIQVHPGAQRLQRQERDHSGGRRFRLRPERRHSRHRQCLADRGGVARLLLYRRAERGSLRQCLADQGARRFVAPSS